MLLEVVLASAIALDYGKEQMEYKTRKRNGKKQFYWSYDDPYTGKTKELASYNKNTLETKIAAKKAELGLGSQALRPFGAYLEDWLEHVQLVGKRQTTAQRYRLDCKKIKDSPIATIPMCRLDDRIMQRFYNDYFTQTDSASQVKTLHKIIRPCVRYAAIRHDISVDFMPLVKLPKDRAEVRLAKQKRADGKALSRTEQRKLTKYLFHCLTDSREASHAMVILANLYMGMRIGETLALRWRDVVVTSDLLCLKITKQVQHVRVRQPDGSYKWEYVVGEPKSKYGKRTLMIPDVILPAFMYYRKVQ